MGETERLVKTGRPQGLGNEAAKATGECLLSFRRHDVTLLASYCATATATVADRVNVKLN